MPDAKEREKRDRGILLFNQLLMSLLIDQASKKNQTKSKTVYLLFYE